MGKESAPKEPAVLNSKKNLLETIRASKELGDPFGIARVRHPNSEVLERILEAVDGEYSSVRNSQVSFVTYMSRDQIVGQLSRFADVSDLELQLTWYDDPNALKVGDIYKRAHDTQKIDKSYELAQKSA